MAKCILCRARVANTQSSLCRSTTVLKEVNHQLESRMRENRQSGSEGGGAETNCLSLPLLGLFTSHCRGWYFKIKDVSGRGLGILSTSSKAKSRCHLYPA